MIIALALLVGAAATAWLLPRLLHRLTGSRVDPAVAITWWFLSCAGVLVTAAASVAMIVLPDHGPARSILNWVHSCWSALSHGDLTRVEDVLGGVALLAIVGVAVQVGDGAARRRARMRAERQRQLDLLRVLAGADADTSPVVWVDYGGPLAYSVAGNPGLVVVSSGLRDHLAPDQLAAVLAHERAHVRGRHHLLVGLADAIAGAASRVPLARALPAAVRTLVEMAADREAAAGCGAPAVTAALHRVRTTAPPGALAIATDDVAERIDRLSRSSSPCRVRRLLALAAALPGAIALPAVVGFAALAVGAAVCSVFLI
ncbi:M56 family metallopeptidase [Actinokineospora guangxiensis]|uniref:M56 family metallopeptidase n=1 Tax=Actinokineospora guangxiensis TaxID=1490288 RepID=A0ABW0EM74_9PSEU